LAGGVGAGVEACAPNPASTERKSPAGEPAEESDASKFDAAVLALELAAPFALAAAEEPAASVAREALLETFLSAMCGSLG
jgi:hypothetical protein